MKEISTITMGVLDAFYFWHGKDVTTCIDVTCLLPNGICVNFPSLRADTPLKHIKVQLWKEAGRFARREFLREPNQYVFVVVSRNGGTEELIDEEQSLFDAKPVRPYLRLIQRQGDEQLKQLNSKISLLIGKPATTSKDEQICDFRRKALEFCNRIAQERGRASWERRAIYSYPPDFVREEHLTPSLREKLDNLDGVITINLFYKHNHVYNKETHKVSHKLLPRDVIEKVLQKFNIKNKTEGKPESYVLKEHGSENFFLGYVEKDTEKYLEQPLIQYKVCLLIYFVVLSYS